MSQVHARRFVVARAIISTGVAGYFRFYAHVLRLYALAFNFIWLQLRQRVDHKNTQTLGAFVMYTFAHNDTGSLFKLVSRSRALLFVRYIYVLLLDSPNSGAP